MTKGIWGSFVVADSSCGGSTEAKRLEDGGASRGVRVVAVVFVVPSGGVKAEGVPRGAKANANGVKAKRAAATTELV